MNPDTARSKSPWQLDEIMSAWYTSLVIPGKAPFVFIDYLRALNLGCALLRKLLLMECMAVCSLTPELRASVTVFKNFLDVFEQPIPSPPGPIRSTIEKRNFKTLVHHVHRFRLNKVALSAISYLLQISSFWSANSQWCRQVHVQKSKRNLSFWQSYGRSKIGLFCHGERGEMRELPHPKHVRPDASLYRWLSDVTRADDISMCWLASVVQLLKVKWRVFFTAFKQCFLISTSYPSSIPK